MSFILYLTAAAAGVLASIVGLDLVLRWLLRHSVGYVPHDMAGPDGWFIDTTRQAGIFDHRG
ncbi:MAG: hypothetical protein AAF689_11940 [Pseudomonadota bacterium]